MNCELEKDLFFFLAGEANRSLLQRVRQQFSQTTNGGDALMNTILPNHENALTAINAKLRRLNILVIIALLLILVAIAAVGFILWKQRALEKQQSNLAFSLAASDYSRYTDIVTPQVNTIQFLRRGYSINFDSVKYTQDGLALTGTLGNPTELNITSLAVTFTAQPSFYKVRDKWEKVGIGSGGMYWLWESDWDIGSGQTTIGMLGPGSSAPFAVTIPNVKQTSDPLSIAVSFSGERYAYLR